MQREGFLLRTTAVCRVSDDDEDDDDWQDVDNEPGKFLDNISLCSRNFKNVKLRLDFDEI